MCSSVFTKRKFIALLLAFSLATSCVTPAFAANSVPSSAQPSNQATETSSTATVNDTAVSETTVPETVVEDDNEDDEEQNIAVTQSKAEEDESGIMLLSDDDTSDSSTESGPYTVTIPQNITLKKDSGEGESKNGEGTYSSDFSVTVSDISDDYESVTVTVPTSFTMDGSGYAAGSQAVTGAITSSTTDNKLTALASNNGDTQTYNASATISPGDWEGTIEVEVEAKEQAKVAFAVYSADNNSLKFYKRNAVPSVGDTFEGLTVTKVYTGVETTAYSEFEQPEWLEEENNVQTVTFVDKIQPISTAYWFAEFRNCTSITLEKLDTSNVTNMARMFMGCNLTYLDVSRFNTSNVTNMNGMFGSCYYLTSLDVSNWDTSKVTDMALMFVDCRHITYLSVGGFDTSNVVNMAYMFNYCQGVTSLDVGGWNTSKVTNMTGMFYYCDGITSLNVQSWDTSNVTNMHDMFYNCYHLQEITLGMKWSFNDAILPTPDSSYIPNADGNWYNEAGDAFTATNLKETYNGSTMAGTYYASKALLPAAFAVYSEDDNSLRFYKRQGIPVEGDTFEGLVVTNVYTGIEDDVYYTEDDCDVSVGIGYIISNGQKDISNGIVGSTGANWGKKAPWAAKCSSIRTVVVEDKISPCSTAGWFSGFYNCTTMDLKKLDTSHVTSMMGMFAQCAWLTDIDLSSLNTSNVTDMRAMFECCYKIATLDFSNWDTSSVSSTAYMFMSCYELTSINVSTWDTSNITDMTGMFCYDPKIKTIDVSNWDVSNVQSMYCMFGHCNKLTSLDVSSWQTYSLKNLAAMFYSCNNLSNLDVSNWDTRKAEDMSFMFMDCGFKTIDVSNWDVSSVTNFDGMFYYANVRILDLSNWDTKNATSMYGMFADCKLLEQITFGENLVFTYDKEKYSSRLSVLPTPESALISGADGNWYNEYGDVFTADELVDNYDGATMAGTYYATKQMVDFVIYSADDNSLRFYKRRTVLPKIGDTYDGYTVTAIYKFVESGNYGEQPWSQYAENIVTVEVVDPYEPISTAYWFANFINCVSIDLENLNTINTKNLDGMFYEDTKLEKVILGTNFSFSGNTDDQTSWAYLPTQDNANVLSADGYWYYDEPTASEEDDYDSLSYASYTAEELTEVYDGSTMAGTYYAYSPNLVKAIAVFNRKDGSVHVYNRNVISVENEWQNTGAGILEFSVEDSVSPWENMDKTTIRQIVFEDEITLTSCEKWFIGLANCTYMDLTLLNASLCERLDFSGCQQIRTIALGRYINGVADLVSSSHFWYSSDGTSYTDYEFQESYTPAKAGRYYASIHHENITAIYFAENQSLHFYNNSSVDPEKYENSDTIIYYNVDNWYESSYAVPWSNISDMIRIVIIEDEIYPIYTAHWFNDLPECYSIVNLGNLNTTNTIDMSFMFAESYNLTSLNLSNWNIQNETYMEGMFDGCYKLQKITLGTNWSFNECVLPTPIDEDVWYNEDGTSFTPEELKDTYNGSTMAGTYYAGKPIAFAVYSADDCSLRFYKGIAPPEGSIYNNLTANAVYTDIETDVYTKENLPGWHDEYENIQTVEIVDTIKPISTAYWFYDLINCNTISGLNLLDTSTVTTMSSMFMNCSQLTVLDIGSFDTSQVTDMNQMFANCSSLITVDVSSFDTSNVTNMNAMFVCCASLESLDISNFDMTNVTMNYVMLQYCYRLQQITLGEKTSLGAAVELPAPSADYITNADGNWYNASGVAYTASELQSSYDGSTMAGTYYAVNPAQNGTELPSISEDVTFTPANSPSSTQSATTVDDTIVEPDSTTNEILTSDNADADSTLNDNPATTPPDEFELKEVEEEDSSSTPDQDTQNSDENLELSSNFDDGANEVVNTSMPVDSDNAEIENDTAVAIQ